MILPLMVASSSPDPNFYGDQGDGEIDNEDSKANAKRSFGRKPHHKGLKLFIINGEEVWALNEKNAWRKTGKD